MKKTNTAPQHLTPASRAWWASVTTSWDLDEHHVRLLTLAAQAWDRGEQARQVIATEGLTVTTRDGGARLHPAVRVETDCRLAFARLVRELDLDVDAPKEATRPPALRSIGGARAS